MNTRDMWEAMKELSDKQFKIYMAVYKLADNDVGYCFASDEHIGEKVNKNRRNVNSGISELISLGFLDVLKINKGVIVTERRLYPSNCYKNYVKDSKLKLMKTTYEKKKDKKGDESIIYYNEKNFKKRTSDDSDIRTSDDSDIRTSDDSDIRTSDDSDIVTSSKNNLSKINKLESKNLELVPFENFFKENMGINFTATNQKHVLSLLKKLKTEEAVKSFLYDNYKMAVSNKEKDPSVKTVEGLFCHYLKKEDRIPEFVEKESKKENKTTTTTEIKKDVTVEKNVVKEPEQVPETKEEDTKEIIITTELENMAIEILVNEMGLSVNHINDTKKKSSFRYNAMLKQALKEKNILKEVG